MARIQVHIFVFSRIQNSYQSYVDNVDCVYITTLLLFTHWNNRSCYFQEESQLTRAP